MDAPAMGVMFAVRECFGRRIALVGNGPVDPRHAAEIDAQNMVVRFNACANYGVSGYRTDVLVLCNSGYTGRRLASNPGAINAGALLSAREFWLTKTGHVIAAEELMANSDPNAAGDATDALVEAHIRGRPWRRFSAATYWAAKRHLAIHGAGVSAQPSSGLLTLFHIKTTFWLPCVTLYGFTHEGWQGHAWVAERAFVESQRQWIRAAASS